MQWKKCVLGGLEEWIACVVYEFMCGMMLGWMVMLGGCGAFIGTGGCVRTCLKILPVGWGGRLGAAELGASSYVSNKKKLCISIENFIVKGKFKLREWLTVVKSIIRRDVWMIFTFSLSPVKSTSKIFVEVGFVLWKTHLTLSTWLFSDGVSVGIKR